MRSIKIEGLRESPQCGLWTVPVLLLTSRVSLSVIQVLVDTNLIFVICLSQTMLHFLLHLLHVQGPHIHTFAHLLGILLL